MEETAVELDSKFQATERRLDSVAWKVDQLVGIETAGGERLSAAKLIKSLQKVKKDFNDVVKEVEQLKEDQRTAMEAILQEFQTAMENTEKFKDKLNMPQN